MSRVTLALALLLAGCGEEGPVARMPGPPCPERMAHLEAIGACIDRHEAVVEGGEAVPANGRMPTTEVSFHDSVAACRAAGFRLCTREEWHFACTGVRPGEEGGRLYPYGDTYEHERCNSAQDGTSVVGRALAPGGSREGCVTPEGVYDLSGNLGEWVDGADLTGTLRELRGGSFANYEKPAQCVTDPLAFQPPEVRFDGQGFRCCRDARE
ncbi:MAG: SUMF1/EgtB/PvdO family nonheme iron enzyme [Myxococcota bacterium]|nr:SUMF1/EgtB/PvdO family nonheme iron enzyme [Myxococcota bacterium]